VVKLAAAASERELPAFHERETTAVFCDFRGFTAFARAAPSAEIVEVLRSISGTSDSMLNLAPPGADRLLS